MLNAQRNRIVQVTKHACQTKLVEAAIPIINAEMAKNVQIANVLNVQAIQIVPVTKHAWQTTPVEAVIPIINVEMAKNVQIANV